MLHLSKEAYMKAKKDELAEMVPGKEQYLDKLSYQNKRTQLSKSYTIILAKPSGVTQDDKLFATLQTTVDIHRLKTDLSPAFKPKLEKQLK